MAPRKKKDVSQAWLSRYHDPRAPGSLGGVQRFAKAHQIPLKQAQRVLERDLAYTLHKPRRRRFPTVPVIVGGLDDQWVADLVEVQPLAKYNRGIRYLLTVLDVLSKYAWVQPLKAKTGVALVHAFEKILKQQRRHPNRLQTDRGKEFYNRTFQRWLDEQGIQHFSTEGDGKASVVERFNRTLKERLYRYFTAANTLTFDDVLPELVQGYNATRHRSIGMAPQDVTWDNEEAVWKRLYGPRLKGKKKPQFKVGDRVRLNKIHWTVGPKKCLWCIVWYQDPCPPIRFANGMTPLSKARFMMRIYKKSMCPMCFGSKRYLSVKKIDGWSSGKGGKGEQITKKKKGWPDKYNSWIASQDVTSLRAPQNKKETSLPKRRRRD